MDERCAASKRNSHVNLKNAVDGGPSQAALDASGLAKAYVQGQTRVPVLEHVDLRIRAGELVAMVGRSGSGKSTLLHVLAGLDEADKGRVLIRGEDMTAADVNGRAAIRNRNLGFVYQMHHLLPEFTAEENVAMPLRLGGQPASVAGSAAQVMLEAVGLAHRTTHRPAELSGGERQRVAVARALVARPALILADEPTGNLDRDNAAHVLELMRNLCREQGIGILIATHDSAVTQGVDRVVSLEGGRLSG
ncbi:MAG: ABC transporter ATP-binding protein [Gammaproteobacteria bacterium]|nr:ABC transporter ATP-binding protein [Gammaproteobacteria bacterium]